MKATTFMSIAYLVSKESKCCSLHVGSVIVKDDRVIATGYNGTPAGHDNCRDVAEANGWAKNGIVIPEQRVNHSVWSNVNEIHAELNAILFAARHGISITGATMYVTHSPCSQCAKAIAQSGIRQIVFAEEYDRNPSDWMDILNGTVEIIKIPNHKLTLLNWDNIQFKTE